MREVLVSMTFEEFKKMVCHQSVTVDTGGMGRYVEKKKPLGEWWLSNPRRRQYDGLILDPDAGNVSDGKLNLWRGFGVTPVKGDWGRLRDHTLEVVCNSDQERFDYLYNWMAWAVQHPADRAEVAVVMQGKQGTGKGTLANAMRKLFGTHGLHISSAAHLAGRFNAHMRNCMLLFADEAYWPGDKAAEGSLKRMLTEPTLAIEGKGRDLVEVPNMLHVMMGSNESWVVPAGEDERRYFVMKVSGSRIQDPSWFRPLNMRRSFWTATVEPTTGNPKSIRGYALSAILTQTNGTCRRNQNGCAGRPTIATSRNSIDMKHS